MDLKPIIAGLEESATLLCQITDSPNESPEMTRAIKLVISAQADLEVLQAQLDQEQADLDRWVTTMETDRGPRPYQIGMTPEHLQDFQQEAQALQDGSIQGSAFTLAIYSQKLCYCLGLRCYGPKNPEWTQVRMVLEEIRDNMTQAISGDDTRRTYMEHLAFRGLKPLVVAVSEGCCAPF